MNFSSEPSKWLLEGLEFDTRLFHVGRYCGQWQASTQGLARASFHLLVEGECWLHLDTPPRSVALHEGDAVFLLRDLSFRLSAIAEREQARVAPRQSMEPMAGNEGTGLVCGFFHVRPGLSSLLLEGLPDHLLLRAGDAGSGAVRQVFELILAECQRVEGPSDAVLERLSHLLFLYVLRERQTSLDDLQGLLGLARQPQFAPLLEQLIARPGDAWSLEQMAELCGLSRSAFCKRFRELAGTSPGQVLLNLRMHQACRLLRQGQPVAEAAEACGYQSLAAFSRAFDKLVGVPPGSYRRQFSGGSPQ